MEDAPRVGQIGKAAFLEDRHTMMKTGDNYDHEQAAQEPFIHWLSVPERVQCIKAVDDSGKMLGYVCWGFRGYSRLILLDFEWSLKLDIVPPCLAILVLRIRTLQTKLERLRLLHCDHAVRSHHPPCVRFPDIGISVDR
jgi:hypothetical protein